MSKYLSAQPHLQFEVLDSIDYIDDEEVRVQLNHKRDILVSRPDRFKSHVIGDRVERHSLFIKGHLKVLIPDQKIYLEKKYLPETVEKTLDLLAEKEGLSFPLSDFLRKEAVDESLLDSIIFAEYVGETKISPADCHHLTLQQDNVDWQLWIQKGDKPVPRKLVITYVNVPGSPQYIANFTNWKFPKTIADSEFKLEIPEDAERVMLYGDMMKSIKEKLK